MNCDYPNCPEPARGYCCGLDILCPKHAREEGYMSMTEHLAEIDREAAEADKRKIRP